MSPDPWLSSANDFRLATACNGLLRDLAGTPTTSKLMAMKNEINLTLWRVWMSTPNSSHHVWSEVAGLLM
jgi:hypothetical protein